MGSEPTCEPEVRGLAKRSRASGRSAVVAANYNNLMATADEFFYSATLKSKAMPKYKPMLRLFVAHRT